MMLVTYAFEETAPLPVLTVGCCLRSIPIRRLRGNQLTATRKPQEWSALKNLL